MNFNFLCLPVLLLLVAMSSCQKTPQDKALYEGFVTPPADARPFVRWWWNGNRLQADELKREVNLLHQAGFGGVEINPIAMPSATKMTDAQPIEWLSEEWIKLLGVAVDALHQNGMIADMIVGSGWPFGGEFLKEDQTIQCIKPVRKNYKSGDIIKLQPKDLYKQDGKEDLLYLSLVPENADKKEAVIDLMPEFQKNKSVNYAIPAESGGKVMRYTLIIGIHRMNYTRVILGAPGAAGSVMNHYRKEIAFAYLDRLKKISNVLGRPLSDLIRALFCDSMELSGSNWTDNFADIFYNTYHYRLEPYYPFVFYNGGEGYPEDKYSPELNEELKRVRYDYNRLIVNTFLDNFTKTFHKYCKDNGLLSRYQAYGSPLLMGMMDGYMIPDIPEGNNWLRSPFADIENRAFNWSQKHGTMIWNLYAASAAHNTGKKIVSCESMTSLNNVYNNSLEAIKSHDDMNFISGINHSVLHGFNYSPLEAGFPGWVRYGTFFSEHNTWWPYVNRWVDYNARLSYVFQESRPEKTWAVLPPEGDHWSENGLFREPFQTEPWYCFRMWESFSQAGTSMDYVNETELCGNIRYKGVILCDVRSISPETAQALKNFAKNGGKIVYINQVPTRSLTMADGQNGDDKVKDIFSDLNTRYADRVSTISEPADSVSMLPWTLELIKKAGIAPDVLLDQPDRGAYQIHTTYEEKDIYFFVNALRREDVNFKATFPTQGKKAWLWNPEDGSRSLYPTNGKENELSIYLAPLESMLLVFEPASAEISGKTDVKYAELKKMPDLKQMHKLVPTSSWKLHLKHVNGEKKDIEFSELTDFKDTEDDFLLSFAGEVLYSTTFNAEGNEKQLVLEAVNKGITEVVLNGKTIGTNWYSRPVFKIDGIVKKGENSLKIKYTSLLSNYCRTLKDNPSARGWSWGRKQLSCGLSQEILIK